MYICIYIYIFIYVNCILGYSCVPLSSVIVYVHIYIYIYVNFPIYIYHTNDGSTEAEMCCKLFTLNNNT